MDTNTSGEELLTKTRKPYTLTKQRERWTEDEHAKFVEALRLHGRAWQRIEEHIGTKTAVQIRSHAQKFFTKLEREAQANGIPVNQALDIEIPPPRPKRKPSTPYPRKSENCTSTTSQVSSAKDSKLVSSLSSTHIHQGLDLERDPLPEYPNGGAVKSSGKENQDEAHCSSISSVNKHSSSPNKASPKNPISFRESHLLPKKANGDKELHPKNIDRENNDGNNTLNVPTQAVNPPSMGFQQHQDHVPRFCPPLPLPPPPLGFPAFHHGYIPACHTQDDYNSFLQMSSTFSNLVMSTLLQNPAAHAAASFAASCWPHVNVGSCNGSSTSSVHTDGASPPSMAAIVAATVAAATAWWASHGLLPVCAPFTCSPMSAAAAPSPASAQPAIPQTDNPQKSPDSSSDDSEEIGRNKHNDESKPDDGKEEVASVQEQVDNANTSQKKKLVDRSSCGSNTPSGSDVETDALVKVEEDKEEAKKTEEGNEAALESSNRRARSKDNSSDSWKEVSEEGRMAFDALFARERLPQSFSPPPPHESQRQSTEKEREMWVPMDSMERSGKEEEGKVKEGLVMDELEEEEGRLTLGLGTGKSLKTRRTGFKPYKRCAMEAKEIRMANTSNNQTEENVSKRIRLEGEAST